VGKIYKVVLFYRLRMVYIYKKTIGHKEYYYLRASERQGKRVVSKDIAYLGDSLEGVRKELDKLPQYAEQIRRAYWTIHVFLSSQHYHAVVRGLKLKQNEFMSATQLEELEACRLHFRNEFTKYEMLTQQEIWKNFIVEFAFNTAAIEGNTIKLQEVRNLLQEGLTPNNKTLREVYDLQNTERVFGELGKGSEKVTHEFIQKVHCELMQNIDARVGYRVSDVRVFKASFKATPAPYVKADMDLLLQWLEKSAQTIHPFVRAVAFHHKFEKIHPFMDGNGRTGRMLMNYLLLQSGYPPVVVHTRMRKYYLQALHEADKSLLTVCTKEQYSKLVSFLVQEYGDYWSIFL